MSKYIDIARLQKSTPAQLRDYFNELLDPNSADEVTSALLHAVERGSVTPITFAPWLGVAASSTTVKQALKQEVSVLVRKFAIKQLRILLCRPNWKQTWDEIGGTAGILDILQALSVLEIRQLCIALGRCARGDELSLKREHYTELFKALHPAVFTNSVHKITDQRPLMRYYGLLAPACSEHLVDQGVAGKLGAAWKHVRQRDILRYHASSMKQVQMRCLTEAQDSLFDQRILEFLIRQTSPIPTAEASRPASMDFALTLLRRLVQLKTTKVDDYFFSNQLVRPLLRRAMNKRVSREKVEEIIVLTLCYFELHPSAGKEITSTPGDIIHLVALCWSQQPGHFDVHLEKLFSHPVFGTGDLNEICDWDDFLEGIPPRKRYSLMRFCIRASSGLDLDVDADLGKMKHALSIDVLSQLPREQALSLFDRLRAIRGETNLIKAATSKSIFNLHSKHDGLDGDPQLYRIHLLKLNERQIEAETFATEYISTRKAQAVLASTPELRAFYAKSALFAGVSSGSLGMYEKVLDWSTSFFKDPLVCRDLFPWYYQPEIIDLLSGIPISTAVDLRQGVQAANSLLAKLFHTACAALKEPSFQSGDWQGVFRLFFEVVKRRIEFAPKLKLRLNVSDDELYQMLWDPTLTMIIAVEEEANIPGRERLDVNTMRGILDCTGGTNIELDTKDASTYTFFDRLAKARDGLWRKLRSHAFPHTDSLPESLPLGLPVQHLTAPWCLNTANLELHAPFLASRVLKTLFQDKATVVEPIEDNGTVWLTMGVFVDSYQHALKLYVPRACDKVTRAARVREAWEYAIGPLSDGRMDKEEAQRFWSSIQIDDVREWPPVKLKDAAYATWPTIPRSTTNVGRVTWDPFATGYPNIPARELGHVTLVDLSTIVLSQTPHLPKIDHTLDESTSEVPAYEADAHLIWDEDRDMGEGGVVSAMLYLHTLFSLEGHEFLDHEFPDQYQARYPALVLPDEFVKRRELNAFIAVRSMRGHLNAIPPWLIHSLARNLIAALESADVEAAQDENQGYATLHEAAMRLIIHLGESDHPDLASQLVVQTILSRPKSSSWHRLLLKPSFLRRLPASKAHSCILDFAEQVLGHLEAEADISQEQGQNEPIETGPNKDSQHSPFVKVTTVKFLAQLLRGAEFLREDLALSKLSILADKADHIDVRVNIVKSLLKILQIDSPPHIDQTFAILEVLVPLAGSLDEHNPLSETEWLKAEASLSLPVFDVETPDSMLQVLLSFYTGMSSDAPYLGRYVKNILIPILERLAQQTAKWVALFLRTCGLETESHEALSIPIGSRQAEMIETYLFADESKMRYLPRSLVEGYIAHKIWNVAPPSTIRALNEKFREDPSARSEAAVKIWLQWYGQGLGVLVPLQSFDFLALCGQVEDAMSDSAVTPNTIQEQYLRLFTAVLWNDSLTYKSLSNCLLQRLTQGDDLAKPWWPKYGGPTVESMISEVDTIRTRDWERNPERQPSVLPDTFPWRLLLLDYPWPQQDYKEVECEEKCTTFAKQLHSTIDSISGSLYHTKLEQLKSYLNIDPVSSAENLHTEKRVGKYTIFYERRDPMHEGLMHNRVSIAINLGDIKKTMLSWLTVSDILRVEIAAYLVSISGDLDDIETPLKERLRALVETWTVCENEGVRRVGHNMIEDHFNEL